jgi:hypothetical protein
MEVFVFVIGWVAVMGKSWSIYVVEFISFNLELITSPVIFSCGHAWTSEAMAYANKRNSTKKCPPELVV